MKGGSAHERLPNISQTDPQKKYDHEMLEDESNLGYDPHGRGFHPIKNESFSPVRRDLRDSDEDMRQVAVSLKVVPRKTRRALETGPRAAKNDYMV